MVLSLVWTLTEIQTAEKRRSFYIRENQFIKVQGMIEL